MQSRGQEPNLPSACVGSIERYGVYGFNGQSTFTWTIKFEDGTTLDPSLYTYIDKEGRGDSIEVRWDASLKGGFYTFEVVEHPIYTGCGDGDPYSQDVMLNSPEIFIPLSNILEDNMAICIGKTARLDPGSGYLDYLWQDSTTNQLFFTGDAGTYKVRLVDSGQNCYYDTTNLSVKPLPDIPLGRDTVLFGSQTLSLDVYSNDFVSYKWSTGSEFPSITVDGSSGNQNIWVTVVDIYGCTDTATIKISAADYSNLRIPAAFTPNGDAINDKWYFPAPDGAAQDLYPYFDNIEVHVFNRWGKLVWESSKDFIAWDGKDLNGNVLPMDSYHYVIRLKVEGKTFLYKGSVTIIR